MLVEQQLTREAYWLVAYLSHFDFGTYACVARIARDMHKRDIRLVQKIGEPLVEAGIIEKTDDNPEEGYRLARPANKSFLVDIHQAQQSQQYQETSSIALLIDHLLKKKTVYDLVEFEEEHLADLVHILRI
jgi:DNA-binding IscR family transcriptional regulator